MTAPDRTPERVVEELQKLLGTGESPAGSNCNWITARFGLGCVAWCDEGWWTALFNAGFNDGHGHIDMPGVHTDYALGDAYVPSTLRHFQAARRLSRTPVAGAGEIHYWGGGEGNSHVAGYIKDYGDGTHLNIECNHNNVCEYVRRSNSDPTIMGYCIPVYISAPTPTPTPTPTPKPQVLEENDMQGSCEANKTTTIMLPPSPDHDLALSFGHDPGDSGVSHAKVSWASDPWNDASQTAWAYENDALAIGGPSPDVIVLAKSPNAYLISVTPDRQCGWAAWPL